MNTHHLALLFGLGLGGAASAQTVASMEVEADLWSKSHAGYSGWLTGASVALLDGRGQAVHTVDIPKLYADRGHLDFSVETDKEAWSRVVAEGVILELRSDQVTEIFELGFDAKHGLELTSTSLKRTGWISWYADSGGNEPLW